MKIPTALPGSIVEERTERGVPCLRVSHDRFTHGSSPVLVFYHGWSRDMHSQLFLAEIVAAAGYVVVLPEARNHGRRSPLPDYWTREALGVLWRIVLESSEECLAVCEAQLERGKTVVLGGSSLGGLIAAATFSRCPEARALVQLKSAMAWALAKSLDRERNPGTPVWGSPEADAALGFDPMSCLERYAERPILLLHGTLDKTFPIQIQADFVKRLEEHCLRRSQKRRVELVSFDEVGHKNSLDMVGALLDFLSKTTSQGLRA